MSWPPAPSAGCGSDGGTDPSRFLPPSDAARLESLVGQAVRANGRGECDQAEGAVQAAREQLEQVPETVAKRLTRNIDDWLVYLGETIGSECGQEPESTPSATASPTESPTETPDKTTEETPTPSPTPEETETPTPSPTASPEPTASPTPSPIPDNGGAIGED